MIKNNMSLGIKIAVGVLAAVAAVGIVFGVTRLTGPDEPPQAEDDLLPQSEQQTEPEPGPTDAESPPEQQAEPEPADESPSPELLALLDNIIYYGDKSRCKLTAEQAAAFAEVIRRETSNLLADAKLQLFGQNPQVGTYAALFDVGDGTPALFFGGGAMQTFTNPETGAEYSYWSTVGTAGIWQYLDGQAVPYAPEGMEPGGYWGEQLTLRDGYLFIGGQFGSDGSTYSAGVYPLTGSTIPTTPQTSAGYEPKDLFSDFDPLCTVDGAEVSWETFEVWRDQWQTQTVLCGHYWDGGVGGSFDGLGDAAAMADALAQYAVGAIHPGGGISSALEIFTKPSYAQAYAQKVRELLAANLNLTFDLIYIDGDDIPELLVDNSTIDASWFSIYTFADGELCTLDESIPINVRAYIGYYPGENLVEHSYAALSNGQTIDYLVYYQISGTHQWEQRPVPESTPGEIQYLRGAMTGDEILAQLES